MTALCGGGASGPRDGVAETVIYTTGSLASLLNNRGGAWASLVAPLLGVLAYSATTLCASDPPDAPTLTAEEYTALLQLQPLDLVQSALGKLADMVKRAVWFDLCQCTSVVTPGAPNPLFPAPADVSFGGAGIGNCPSRYARLTFTDEAEAANVGPLTNITPLLFPELPLFTGAAGTGYLAQQVAAIPPGWVNFTRLTDLISGGGDATHGYTVRLSLYSASLAIVNFNDNNFVSSTYPSSCAAPPGCISAPLTGTGHSYFAFNVRRNVATDGVVDLRLETVCGDAPTLSGCCPADPAAQALVQQLLGLVTQQQRWRLPFATVDGASHAVSGVGSFAVDRAVGLRVDITAQPAGLRTSLGNPTYVFDLGWLSVSDGGGMLQEMRVTRDTHTWLPQQMQLATTVGYALRAGVTATITELLVEP